MPQRSGRLVQASLAAGMLAAAALATGTARADCYELIGCNDSEYMQAELLGQLSCENLWFVRNRIYDQNGYCFRSDRALEVFDNSDCTMVAMEAVKLNAYEWRNISTIVSVERPKGCQ